MNDLSDRRFILEQQLAALVRDHEDAMLGLYDAIAAEWGHSSWETMKPDEKQELIDEAREYCETIDREFDVWQAAQVQPLDAVALAVLAQHSIARKIRETESELVTHAGTQIRQ